jgi:hypothetical protein
MNLDQRSLPSGRLYDYDYLLQYTRLYIATIWMGNIKTGVVRTCWAGTSGALGDRMAHRVPALVVRVEWVHH